MASVESASALLDAPRNDDIGVEQRLELFRLQVEIRDCEKRAYDLFLQNLIKGTSHLSLGQEAVAAGFGVAMRKGDKSFCTYRGHAHTLARGAPMEGMLGELMLRDYRRPSPDCLRLGLARTISLRKRCLRLLLR
jgi:TPP-dependent pyruvate/acetoin dehydrogenase alpha subunit